jgi:hypothetical protein
VRNLTSELYQLKLKLGIKVLKPVVVKRVEMTMIT